jgi:hypothetical protein
MNNFITLSRVLAYAGTLPFIGATLDAWSVLPLSQWFGISLSAWAMAYAAVILSFLAGMHWVYAMMAHTQSMQTGGIGLLINANVVALWAWIMWGLSPYVFATLGLAAGFLWMLWWDASNRTPAKETPWFWSLRWQATLIAVISLLLIAGQQSLR